MIEVSIDAYKIKVTGHAGQAPKGSDIVCAGVSALVYSLMHSLRALTKDKVSYRVRDGDVIIEYNNLSEQGQLLVDSFFIGISDMIESYPGYVTLAP